jgi:glutamine synthetase
MNLEALRQRIAAEKIDTVIVCLPDVQGRLVGKRHSAEFFLNTLQSGTHVCDYLFTVDFEGTPIPGFAAASWEKGYGDYVVMPDYSTWKRAPWLPASYIVIGDCLDHQKRLVTIAPRAVLQSQIEAARKRGYALKLASELEFYLFEDSFDECLAKAFQNLRPSSPYSQDYNLLRTTRAEPLLQEVREAMAVMGISVESTKGEWGAGQHEISLRYADPLTNADHHVLYKHAIKEIAAKHGRSVTFMAKPSADMAGSSCHIHASLWSVDGTFCRSADPDAVDGLSEDFRHFIAGILAYARDCTLFFAPTVNSYKRFQAGSFAPTRLGWGRDNRTSGCRLIGQGESTRIELRVPGADTNPYLAYAAMIAAGLKGIEQALPLPQEAQGNAYENSTLAEVPKSLTEAVSLLDRSETVREALGDDVVDHYVHAAKWELSQYEAQVTEWERRRFFERT